MIGAVLAKRAIRSAFEALNKGDLEKFMKGWSKDSVWIYPGKVKSGGKFVGKDNIKNWFQDFIRKFPQRKFTLNHIGVENILDLMGNNTVSAQWNLELINKDGLSITNSGVTIIKIKGSKVVQSEDFLETSDGESYKRAWGDSM